MRSSLEFLSTLLHNYHKKRVIVLIDEYDAPAQVAYLHDFYEEFIDFLKSLLTAALKDNSALEKGVLTGILMLAKAGIFSGLNNLEVFTITRTPVADKFGFTKDEVSELLHYYNLENNEKAIAQWYNGYTFGKTTEIFNPWSVLNCVRYDGALEKYWVNTSDNALVKRAIAKASGLVKSDLELLLSDKEVDQSIEDSITFSDLERRPNLIWSLLLYTGYATYKECKMQVDTKVCSLVIPNQEIRSLYLNLIRAIFDESVVSGQAQNLLLALLQGDNDMLTQLLQNFVLTSMSMYDISASEPEKSYHLFVLGLLVLLDDRYEVKSNRESGLGRYDIMLIPREKNNVGIVIEFKVARKSETLEDAAQKALDQILAKNYIQELRSRKIDKIRLYGIAFEGKQLFIISRFLNNSN